MAKEQKGLNADDIAHDIHRDLHHLSLTKGACEEIVRGVFAAIKGRLAAQEVVNIRGFGVFEAKVFKGRTLNSPLVKGGSIDFADQLVLRFRQSQAAKREINEIAKAAAKGKKAANKDKAAKGKAKPAEAEAEATEAEAKPAKKANGAAKKGAAKAAAKPAKKAKGGKSAEA